MADAQPGSAFYERSWFKGTAAVVALAVSLAALVGPPRLWDVIADIVSPELPGSNTEIVIDASAAMGEEFPPSGSKLQAQAGAVNRYAANLSNEGLALRTFGGECDEGGDLVVDLGEEHGDDVGRAAADQQPQGKANLVSALARAIDDFTADDIPDDSKNRVVVFTGTGTDECYGTNAPAEINREIERTGIDAEFRLVGLHVEKADQQQL
jgi:hypothetical protein